MIQYNSLLQKFIIYEQILHPILIGYFWLLNTKSTPLILFATIIALNLGHGAMHGPQAAFFFFSCGHDASL